MRAFHLLLCVVTSLLVACGGGGGEEDENLVLGAFERSAYGLTVLGASPTVMSTTVGSLESTGTDRIRIDLVGSNFGGTVQGPATLAHGLELDADGAIRLVGDPGSVGFSASGGLSQDGRFGLLAEHGTSSSTVALLLKLPDAPFDATRAPGAYHMVSMHQDDVGGGRHELAVKARATFGPSEVSFSDFLFSGSSPICIGVGPESYDVTDGGRLTIGGISPLTGTFESGGDVAIVAGRLLQGAPPEIAAFVRESVGHSDASTSGTYWLAGFTRNATGLQALRGTAEFDGVGGATFSFDQDGVPVIESAIANVDEANGGITLQLDGLTFAGGISPDGAFMALAGAFGPTGMPTLLFLARR